ncbi:MAG: sporulation protein YunB [Candidatus Epulonipiscium fishelsonii]|nr:MAG: sporulation protein YunB [Epulopiscium sp. AS2M-Bin002]
MLRKKKYKQNYYPPYAQPKIGFYKKRNEQLLFQKIQGVTAILIIIAIVGAIYIQLDEEILPTVMAMAELETTSIATEAINVAITETLLTNQITIEDLLTYDYNDDGELISWNVNSILINNLCNEIVSKCAKELKNIGTIVFQIPLGNATGSRLFANLGPEIKVEIMPIGTVTVDYENNIKETGINQINHTVWLDIKTTLQVVSPLFSNQIKVDRKIMLIDKILSGAVPPNYVNIPEEDFLDFVPD